VDRWIKYIEKQGDNLKKRYVWLTTV